MKSSSLLRAASVVTFLFAAGHTLGATDSWSPPGVTEVLQAMKSFHFMVMGANRSYWDFYFGFGLILGIYQLLQAVLLWQMATIAKTDPERVRPMTLAFLAASVLATAMTWRYFFAVPLVFQVLTAVLLLLALLAKRERAAA